MVEIPALPLAGACECIAFNQAAGHGHHDPPCKVSSGFIEDAGSIGHCYFAARAGGNVNIVVTDGDIGNDARLISASRFENRAPDHAIFIADKRRPRIELEMTLCMWRNHFTCDILAERGTAHIESLCKWGPTTFRHRRRVLPSGSPPETAVTLTQDDPTWALEYEHFRKLCGARTPTDLSNDLTIQRTLRRLAKDVPA